MVHYSLSQTAPDVEKALNKVYIAGGLAKMKFGTKLQNLLRNDFEAEIVDPSEPELAILRGIEAYDCKRTEINRIDYQEKGEIICQKRFW